MDYEKFLELATLQALDLLDASGREAIAAYLQRFPEAQTDLAQLQAAAHTLPYGLPESSAAPELKQRLMQRIQADPGKLRAQAQ